jgi:DNA repair ATPase RecN
MSEANNLNEWLREAGFDPEELTTVRAKQDKLREHYQSQVDTLEEKKEKLDKQVQQLLEAN